MTKVSCNDPIWGDPPPFELQGGGIWNTIYPFTIPAVASISSSSPCYFCTLSTTHFSFSSPCLNFLDDLHCCGLSFFQKGNCIHNLFPHHLQSCKWYRHTDDCGISTRSTFFADHVVIALCGQIKGEDHKRCHLLPSVLVAQSGVKAAEALER